MKGSEHNDTRKGQRSSSIKSSPRPSKWLILVRLLLILSAVILLNFGAIAANFSSGRAKKEAKDPDEGSGNDKPWFVLHVGPPKTASTTLQVEMTYLNASYWDNFTAADNYIYAGKSNRDGNTALYRSLDNTACHTELKEANLYILDGGNVTNRTGIELPECWKDFLRRLSDARNANRNVIASQETFGFVPARIYWNWLAFSDAFERTGWNLLVALTYRRFHEWIVSVKSQMDRENRARRKRWPRMGGYPPPQPFFQVFQRWARQRRWHKYVYADELMGIFRAHNVQFEVINPYAEGRAGIVSTFLCDVVPKASQTCMISKSREQAALVTNANQALSFDYDNIACQAAKMSLFNASLISRDDARRFIQRHHTETLNRSALPMNCPNALQLSMLLNVSLEMEQRVMPEFYASPSGRASLEEGFWDAANAGRFCSIDAGAVLRNPSWSDAFSSLAAHY